MDLTYEKIIKPAVLSIPMRCLRNDEIRSSGHVEEDMYIQLLLAHVVIADISTMNINAIYELGVRHALRPHTTIILAERKMRLPWNLEHFRVEWYTHGGDRIDQRECDRMIAVLRTRILEALRVKQNDSPVYTFLKELNPPGPVPKKRVPITTVPIRTLGQVVAEAEAKREASDFAAALELFEEAAKLDGHDEYLVQQKAFCMYKLAAPGDWWALEKALAALQPLNPDETTDTETIGMAGSIRKRQFWITREERFLDHGIALLSRGYQIRPNPYNGINLAFLLNEKGFASQDLAARRSLYWQANQVRSKVERMCEEELARAKGNPYWLWATRAEARLGLGNLAGSEEALNEALSLAPSNWRSETTLEQMARLKELLQADLD